MDSKDKNQNEEVDIFRDTPLRYLGYANEIGEAFRSMISIQMVKASYGVAFGYVFMDVIDKSMKTYKNEKKLNENTKSTQSSPIIKSAKHGTDCFLWQTFASVLIPGFTINRICATSSLLLNKTNVNLLVKANKPLTTIIGLCSIPVIIHPIDHFVHQVMDKTVRPLLGIDPYLK